MLASKSDELDIDERAVWRDRSVVGDSVEAESLPGQSFLKRGDVVFGVLKSMEGVGDCTLGSAKLGLKDIALAADLAKVLLKLGKTAVELVGLKLEGPYLLVHLISQDHMLDSKVLEVSKLHFVIVIEGEVGLYDINGEEVCIAVVCVELPIMGIFRGVVKA